MPGIEELSEMKEGNDVIVDSDEEEDDSLEDSDSDEEEDDSQDPDKKDCYGLRRKQIPVGRKPLYVVDEYFDEEFEEAIEHDRADAFVDMLNDLRPKKVALLDPLPSVFANDAVHCLDAVLNGKTAALFEINVDAVPPSRYNEQQALVPILHKAAQYGAAEITNYLCCHHPRVVEAQVNLRIDDDVDGLKGALPLSLWLQRLRDQVEESRRGGWVSDQTALDPKWISEPSPKEPERLVLNWIFHLCDPDCKEGKEIVRLLAPRTHEIEQEFFKYMKEGKMFELTALLMLARDSVMPGLEGSSKVRDIVLKESADLKIFIFRSTYDIDSDKKLMLEAMKKKKMEMEAILLLLEIFDRIGDKIEAYSLHCTKRDLSPVERVREFSWLLKEAGFDADVELLDEITRDNYFSDKFGVFLDTSEDERVEEPSIEIIRDDRKPNVCIIKSIGDSKPERWLVNKQKMLSRLDYYGTKSNSLRLYHTYHLPRGCQGFRSMMANKGDGCDSSCRVLSDAYNRPTGMLSKLQLKKQYQDLGKTAGMTRGCGRASDLQFNGGGFLSANSSRRILWITSKLNRALGSVAR